jgi:2-desacetyl-2-hydroxyethyl bacteriochlorophyllide A dehydrogenase
MRQITLQQPGAFVSADVAPPRAGPGEALVRVHRVGVCGTDLHAFAGRQPFFSYPRVLGHELGVEVLEAPPGEHGLRPGDRCAVEPYLSCGRCHACRLGKTNCCETLQVLGVHCDGGMVGLLAVPAERLYKSERLSLDQLALVETLGIGAHAVARSGLRPGEEVLVVGAGPIGLAVVQFARAAGGRVRVIDLSPARRAFAERFGVETLAGPDGRLAEVVFDATGSAAAMQASFDLVAHGGRLVFVGLVQDRVSFDDPLFHRRELTLLASRNSCGDFPRIIRLIEEGHIDTAPWVTHRLGLAEVPRAFAGLRGEPGLVKAMIEVGDADR